MYCNQQHHISPRCLQPNNQHNQQGRDSILLNVPVAPTDKYSIVCNVPVAPTGHFILQGSITDFLAMCSCFFLSSSTHGYFVTPFRQNSSDHATLSTLGRNDSITMLDYTTCVMPMMVATSSRVQGIKCAMAGSHLVVVHQCRVTRNHIWAGSSVRGLVNFQFPLFPIMMSWTW
jgi:hypothetical protein